jgi:SulP family sulfate permease
VIPSPSQAPRLLRLPTAARGIVGIRPGSIPAEIIAGITLAALMIPLNIGYARVAGLPPEVGLYAAIVPSIVFGLLAHSRHLVSGPDAAIGAMLAGMLGALAAPGDPRYMDLALATTLLCGVIFLAFWLFRLGFLANFLSHAVLVGFITGLGIEVLMGQVRSIMGVTVDAEGFFRALWQTVLAIPATNPWSLGVGLGTVAVIRLVTRVSPKAPGALLALVAATAAVAVLGLDARGVTVLGHIQGGLPSLTVPHVGLSDLVTLLPIAVALCAATLAEAPLLARSYAERYHEPVDADQDMFAFAAANAAAAFTGGMAVGSSASRTAAVDSVGARTQLPSLVAGVVVAVVLLFFTDLLALLPSAALAGIVANAVLGLIDVKAIRQLWHRRRSEWWVAMTAVISVLVLGVLQGVAIAFLLSVIDLLWRAANPSASVLVESADGEWFDVPPGPGVAETRPGLVIYRFGAAIYFANAPRFGREAEALATGNPSPVRWFVLDASAINDIDTSGARALRQLIDSLEAAGITFAVSRPREEIRSVLRAHELLDAIGNERIFATNRDAVAAFERAAPS